MMLSKVVLIAVSFSAFAQMYGECTFAVTPDHLNFKAEGETKGVKVISSSTTCMSPGGFVVGATWLQGAGGTSNNNVASFAVKADANTGAERQTWVPHLSISTLESLRPSTRRFKLRHPP